MEDRLAGLSSWRRAVRQILCAYLRQWAIDRYLGRRRLGREREREHHGQAGTLAHATPIEHVSPHQPLVLVKHVATRQVIMAASREAMARGIDCGMTLAEACALCPNLEHGEYQPREDRKGLMVLGRWMMRFSP